MEDNYLVSIIVPVYNAELNLRDCLNSILSQTYENIEVIIVDDGSTDRSKSICEEYAKLDSRVILISQKNSGPSGARNLGINVSNGEYIQFVDSDDILEQNMTRNLVGALNENNQLVICGAKVVNFKNKSIIGVFSPPNDGEYNVSKFLDHFGEFFVSSLINPLWNKLYKTEVIKKNQIRFIENINMGEDLLFNLEYIGLCKSICVIKDQLYNYLLFNNENSLTGSYKKDFFENQQMLYQNIRNFLLCHDSYSEKNKFFVEKNYAGSIMGCIVNLFHKESNLTSIKKKEEIRKIVNDTIVQDRINYFKEGGFQQNVIGFLIKHQYINAIYITFQLMSYLKNKIKN